MRTALSLMIVLACLAGGCASSRMTDTSRTGIELLLLSTATDRAAKMLDLAQLKDRKVFLDSANFEGTDKGYAVNAIRERIASQGAHIVEDRKDAEVIAEAACGGIGTDSSESLIGLAAFEVSVLGTGVKTPELALWKTVSQSSVSKLAVYARESKTGRFLFAAGPWTGRAYYNRYTILFIMFKHTDIPEESWTAPDAAKTTKKDEPPVLRVPDE